MRKLLSLCIIFCLCLGALSVSAGAEEAAPAEAAAPMSDLVLPAEITADETPVTETPAEAVEDALEEDAAPEESVPAADGAGDVALDGVNFPDETFRAFVTAYDTDESGALSDEELKAVKAMDCEGLGIADLTGIEHFTWLTELLCGLNELTALDVSALVNLDWLAVNSNRLASITLPKGGVLTRLDCSGNALTSLSLSGAGDLIQLCCHGNDLTSIDLTGSAVLKARLDTAKVVKEEGIVCHLQEGAVYSLVLSCDEGVALIGLGVAVNEVNFPDDVLRAYVDEYRDKNHNGYLSAKEIKNVTVMNCEGLGIADLTGVEYFTELTVLLCGLNELTELDVSMLTKLDWVGANGNKLTSIALPESGTLLRLDCSGNELTELDVSGQTGLVQLACHDNDLTVLDLTQNTALLDIVRGSDPIAEEGILCWLVPGASYPSALTCDEDTTVYRLWMRLGDVTGDGLVTAEDALEVLQYLNGRESVFGSTEDEVWEKARLKAADVLKDSRADVRDAAQILRYASGLGSLIG